MRTAVGIDVSLRRGLDLVLLGEDLTLAAPPRSRVPVGDLTAVLADWAPAVVAVDAPSQWGVAGRSRTGERALMGLGIRCYATPSDPAARTNPFYAWMHVGHEVFAAAAAAGYAAFDGGRIERRCVEVFPHATAIRLRGELPAPGWRASAAGKRAWRAEALRAAGLGAKDLAALRTQDQIDAALAAVTGVLALRGDIDVLGDPTLDGVIVLPTARTAPARPPA